MHHVMILTLLHHRSSVHSHISTYSPVSLIFSYLFLFYSRKKSSLILDLFLVYLNMCTVNIRPFSNPLHYTATIADLAAAHNNDVFALTDLGFLLTLPLSLVFYFSSYAQLLSVLSYLIQQQTITYMLMILNISYHSQRWIALITSLTLAFK